MDEEELSNCHEIMLLMTQEIIKAQRHSQRNNAKSRLQSPLYKGASARTLA